MQEGQIFHDSDVFAAKNLSDFSPFNFKEELLYVKNVTFHNYKSKQWEPNHLHLERQTKRKDTDTDIL